MGSWSIRLRVVLVVALGVVVAVAATIFFTLSGFRSEADAASKNALAESRVYFGQLKTRDTAMLSAVLDSLMSREDLKKALAAGDRSRLEALSAPVFAELRATYGITHLYFITPDGHVLLRAHQPAKYGDLIARKSLAVARSTGGYGTELELGKTAYALRVVHSVALSTDASEAVDPHGRGSLIGYMEAGEEIGHFLQLMRSQSSGDEFALLVPKSALAHGDWTALRAEQHLPDNWDQLSDWVAAGSTEPSLAVGLSLPVNPSAVPTDGVELALPAGNHQANVTFGTFPVLGADGKAIGIVIARHDLTPMLVTARGTAVGIVTAYGVITALLGLAVLALLNALVFRRLDRMAGIAEHDSALASRLELDDDIPIREHDEIARFEETLRRGLRELTVKSQLLDSITDIVYVHDLDGRIFYANQAASTILGYSHEEMLGKSIQDLVPEAIRPVVKDNIAGIVSDGRRIFESSDVKASGEQVPVEVHSQTTTIDGSTYVISAVRDLSERKRVERTIERLAYFDPLTGAANRRLFQDRLAVAQAHARRTGSSFALAFLDVDKLKPVNDSLGHAGGDAVLREVAERLRRLVRDVDTVARLGGDEFGLLLPETQDEGVLGIGARLAEVMAVPVAIGSERASVSVSAGVAVWTPDDDGDSMLRKADVAMYKAKEQGGGRWLVFDDSMLVEITERYSLQADLKSALDRGALELHYQPQIDLADGRVVGAEALSRWNDPVRGSVPADTFIDVAEQGGLIVDLGRWAIETACRDVAEWRKLGLPELQVAVNVSASQFADDDLPAVVAQALSKYGVDASMIALEITESVALTGSPVVVGAMHSLAELGVQLVIDDFGVGYSALDNIAELPISALKVDRAFVKRIGSGSERDAIVRTIVDLGHHLGLATIAEGVEKQSQIDALRAMGCETAQGFWFARAMPADQFAEFVREGDADTKSL